MYVCVCMCMYPVLILRILQDPPTKDTRRTPRMNTHHCVLSFSRRTALFTMARGIVNRTVYQPFVSCVS